MDLQRELAVGVDETFCVLLDMPCRTGAHHSWCRSLLNTFLRFLQHSGIAPRQVVYSLARLFERRISTIRAAHCHTTVTLAQYQRWGIRVGFISIVFHWVSASALLVLNSASLVLLY